MSIYAHVLITRTQSQSLDREEQTVMNKNYSNNTSGTNWEALAAISDDNIDYSDIPPLTDEFFERATLRTPAAQAQKSGSVYSRQILPRNNENRKSS
jgi:hypothetical protein